MKPSMDAPLNLFGYPTHCDLLTTTEQTLLRQAGRWCSFRGPFGVVWLAKRDGVAHIKGRFCSRFIPCLETLLTNLQWKTLVLLALLASGCSSNSAGPTPTPPPAQTITLTGHLTAVNGGQAIAGVQAALGATTALTGGDGAFNASGPPTASLSLSLTGSGIVPRRLQVAMLTTRDLAVDAIALDGQFDLQFYQAFVRDRLESPTLQPLRRWTTSPNLYLQTGADARTLNMVEAVARASVAEWSSGRLSVAAVERGDGSRVGQAGWLTVLFSQEVGHCGVADVGLSGGSITFYPQTVNCGCGGYQVRPTAVRHEVGHAMGFLHTADTTDVMYPVANQCDMPITARERYHAAIAYRRPVGNQDPDVDNAGIVNMAPMRKR